METNPIGPPAVDPLESRVEYSRNAWKRLWMAVRTITPRSVGRALLILGVLGGLIWLVIASWPALAPFVAGAVLAYIVLPMVNALDRVLPRFLAALISVLFALTIIAGVVMLIVPPLIRQSVALLQQIPPDTTIEGLKDQLIEQLPNLPPNARVMVVKAITDASLRLQDRINTLGPSLLSVNAVVRFLNAIGFILGLIVLPTWLLTVLRSAPKARRIANEALLPGMRQDFWAVMRMIDQSFGIFLRGQVLVSLMVGLLTYFGLDFLTRLGAPEGSYPLTFAAIAGILQLIPEVGPLVNIIAVTVLAYRINPQLAIYVFVLYICIQYLVGRLVKDRIESKIIDVNPALLVLFIVALSQLGFLWLFLAAPLAGLSRNLFRYAYGRLSDPPRPAGLLPGENAPAPTLANVRAAQRRTPMIYRRQPARGNR